MRLSNPQNQALWKASVPVEMRLDIYFQRVNVYSTLDVLRDIVVNSSRTSSKME
jgi:hypothetical protein